MKTYKDIMSDIKRELPPGVFENMERTFNLLYLRGHHDCLSKLKIMGHLKDSNEE